MAPPSYIDQQLVPEPLVGMGPRSHLRTRNDNTVDQSPALPLHIIDFIINLKITASCIHWTYPVKRIALRSIILYVKLLFYLVDFNFSIHKLWLHSWTSIQVNENNLNTVKPSQQVGSCERYDGSFRPGWFSQMFSQSLDRWILGRRWDLLWKLYCENTAQRV